MKKNTNVNPEEDYDFSNDTFSNNLLDNTIHPEEFEGLMDYLEDLLSMKENS